MSNRFASQQAQLRRILLELRIEKGFTQAELAEKIAQRQNFVSNYERGERKLEFFELIEILKALDCDINQLIRKIDLRHG